MKKLFILFIAIVVAVMAHGQIRSFSIDASKNYENNTYTSYITLQGEIDSDMAEIITAELKLNSDIQKFSFYDKSNLLKCMVTANQAISETMLVDMINDIFDNQSKILLSEKREFLKSEVSNDVYKVSFLIDGLYNSELSNKICDDFKATSLFVDILITNESICELKSMVSIDFDLVEQIIISNGVTINKDYLK